MAQLSDRLKEEARRLGFEGVGIARAEPADGFARLREWLARGYAGEMSYMERHGEARRDPASILPEVRSVVMTAMSYHSEPLPTTGRGRISRYALGRDYHVVLRERLKALLGWLRTERPEVHGRAVVDTAPLLERDFARRAGLGWIGKNTMLIDKRLGSFLFLGALLLDLALPADTPHDAQHCGTCTACLDACPTQAFVGPGWLDARRCISYLTIELRGTMPVELRPGVGDWLFGCDICQDVCPWNRKAASGREPSLLPRADLLAVDPETLLFLDDAEFRERFGGTALERTRRAGLARNAAIVLGNRGDRSALPALRRALNDREPTVRDAARWAIEAIETRRNEEPPC